MTKVAVCFWGLCRTTNHTIDSIKECIYKPLDEANIKYDIFVHTFSLETPYSNPRNSESAVNLDNELYKLLTPTYVEVEDQNKIDRHLDLSSYRTKGDPWEVSGSIHFSTFDNHIRAIYSLHKVTEAALKGEYDRIVFARPDVKFLNPINPNWLRIMENEIILPDFHKTPVNDRFAIASPASAKVFGQRFLEAKAFSLKYPLHSEEYLRYCLKKAKIRILEGKIRFRRIRLKNVETELDVVV